jgi:hypothetical protein
MKASWLQGLDEQLAKDVSGDFKSSLVTRKRLATLLEEKVKEKENSSLSAEEYNVANWAYKQADLVGYKRAIRDVLNLILE